MHPGAPEHESPDRRNPVVVAAAIGVAVLVVAFVITRWRRGVVRDVADAAGETVVALGEVLFDEMLAG